MRRALGLLCLVVLFLNQAGAQTNTQALNPAEGKVEEQKLGEPNKDAQSFSSELESFLEPFIYDPKGRRDLFRPFVESALIGDDASSGPQLPLQQFEVDQLELVGIIWNVPDPKALFLDPRKQLHTVRRDERIGRKNGYVAVIRQGEVVVVEAVNINGDLMYSTRVLKIQK